MTSSVGPFVFDSFVCQKGLGSKEKKLTFLRLLIIPFENILFLKEFLEYNGCFGLFTKIKKGSWTCFWCTFSAWFSNKNSPYLINTLSNLWTKFQCHTFLLSQGSKQNVLLSSYLDNWDVATYKKKKEWTEIQKFRYLENERSFLHDIKIIFLSF